MPGLLIVGLIIARKRFDEQLPSLTSIFIVLSVLQAAALGLLFKARWRTGGLAACAVLALWASFIMVFEPVERDLYDTRSFTENAMHMIDREPAPLVLHGMGKDAKAIKFMVNLNRDLLPLFTQSAVELQALSRSGMDRHGPQGLSGAARHSLGQCSAGVEWSLRQE